MTIQLPILIRHFLFEQSTSNANLNPMSVPLADCPQFNGQIHIYHSAIARFYAPSDLCGAGGIYHELIWSNPLWYGEGIQHDMVFVTTNLDHDGFLGMCVGRVHLFFSFVYESVDYHCALVYWFIPVGELVHEETGQWVVEPEFIGNGCNQLPNLTVVHVDCIAHGTLLSPVYGTGFLPDTFHFSDSLDVFCSYFVDNHANHHMHKFVPKFK